MVIKEIVVGGRKLKVRDNDLLDECLPEASLLYSLLCVGSLPALYLGILLIN